MVWYSHLFKSFPQFVMIHTVKGFSLANETEVDVVLEFPCFLYDPVNIGNLVSGSFAFSKPSLNIWKFSVHIMLKASIPAPPPLSPFSPPDLDGRVDSPALSGRGSRPSGRTSG